MQKKQPGAHSQAPKNNTIAIILPPPVVETVISSSQSLTSSIGIGEFSMNPAPRGSAVVFCGCERPLVFKTEVSKGHKRSTFGLKHGCHIHLWVLACLLWCIWSQCLPVVRWPLCYCMLKNIHTHFCNDKINMIKQQFNGKLHWLLNNLHVKHAVLKGSHQLLTSLAQPCTFFTYIETQPY